MRRGRRRTPQIRRGDQAVRQTGLTELRVADLRRDAYMLEAVRDFGDALMRKHPRCATPLICRWFGNAQQYAGV